MRAKERVWRKCTVCHKAFQAWRKDATTCSATCRSALRRNTPSAPKERAPRAPREVAGPNLRAAMATIRALRSDGRLKATDVALVSLLTTLAGAVDEAPGNAQLVRQYRETLIALLDRADDDSDALAGLLGNMRAEMGDAASRPTVVGSRVGGDRDETGAAVYAMAAPGRGRRAGTPA